MHDNVYFDEAWRLCSHGDFRELERLPQAKFQSPLVYWNQGKETDIDWRNVQWREFTGSEKLLSEEE